MMDSQRIIQRYERGTSTTTDIILDVLNLSSKSDVAQALKLLPPAVLKELKRFVGYYGPKTRIFRGPRPRMRTVHFVNEWLAKTKRPGVPRHAVAAQERRLVRATPALQTLPIGMNADFRAVQEYADTMLRAKGYKMLEKKGSISWIDPVAKPNNAAVRFKLCNYKSGFFFGAREEWASVLGIPFAKLGSKSHSALPSPVLFRGDHVTNTDAGRQRIDHITALFPCAGDVGPVS